MLAFRWLVTVYVPLISISCPGVTDKGNDFGWALATVLAICDDGTAIDVVKFIETDDRGSCGIKKSKSVFHIIPETNHYLFH